MCAVRISRVPGTRYDYSTRIADVRADRGPRMNAVVTYGPCSSEVDGAWRVRLSCDD